MKKRSLFAAVAMLIVSAILLTSSTYAWFSSANKANVTEFSASVTNTSASIQISASNSTGWTNTLSKAMIEDVQAVKENGEITQHVIASQLNPVSCLPDFTNKTTTFYSASMATVESSGNITKVFTTGTKVLGTDYSQFTVYLKSDADGDVTITPTFTRGEAFTYCALNSTVADKSGATYLVLNSSSSGDGYTPLKADMTSNAITDAVPQNSVVDSGDSGYNAFLSGTDVSTTANQTLTLYAAKDTVYPIVVSIWAEGQDLNCTGTPNSSCALSLTFQYSTHA